MGVIDWGRGAGVGMGGAKGLRWGSGGKGFFWGGRGEVGRFGRGEEGVVDGLRFGSLGEGIGVGGCDETSVGWGMGVSGVGEGRVWREGWEWDWKGKGWGLMGCRGSHSLGVRLCRLFSRKAGKERDRQTRTKR